MPSGRPSWWPGRLGTVRLLRMGAGLARLVHLSAEDFLESEVCALAVGRHDVTGSQVPNHGGVPNAVLPPIGCDVRADECIHSIFVLFSLSSHYLIREMVDIQHWWVPLRQRLEQISKLAPRFLVPMANLVFRDTSKVE
jgi:hypothetical protein